MQSTDSAPHTTLQSRIQEHSIPFYFVGFSIIFGTRFSRWIKQLVFVRETCTSRLKLMKIWRRGSHYGSSTDSTTSIQITRTGSRPIQPQSLKPPNLPVFLLPLSLEFLARAAPFTLRRIRDCPSGECYLREKELIMKFQLKVYLNKSESFIFLYLSLTLMPALNCGKSSILSLAKQ